MTKLSLSIAAALALSAVRVARADSTSSPSKQACSQAARPGADESGNPHSVEYRNRKLSRHSPIKSEVDADETGNPHSPDYPQRPIGRSGNWKAEWEASEADTPYDPRPGARPAPTPVCDDVVTPVPAK